MPLDKSANMQIGGCKVIHTCTTKPSTHVDAVNENKVNQSECGRVANHGANHGRG